MDVLERVTQVFREVFNNKDLVLSNNTCADDILEWDSLMHINLIAMLEEEFSLQFEIDEIISMENVGDMVRIISEILNK